MIIGAKFLHDRGSYNIAQRGNALHYIYNKAYYDALGIKKDWKWKLIWCGPSIAATCFSLMKGYNWLAKKCTIGNVKFQPEDIIGLWFHEKSNFPIMMEVDKNFDYIHDYPNYWMKFYPLMAEMFEIEGNFIEEHPIKGVLIEHLREGNTVQLCLNIGHYVAVGGYDIHNDTFIGFDTWPERTGDYRFTLTYRDIIETCLPAAIYYRG